MNELFSGLLTTNLQQQQQQQPMRINQMTYNEGYGTSNLIDQSKLFISFIFQRLFLFQFVIVKCKYE